VIYSIIPLEIIFKDFEPHQHEELYEAIYQGETLQVAKAENGGYKIVRIISTSPDSFINPELQPGNIVYGCVLVK
jgi:hypothetical protein